MVGSRDPWRHTVTRFARSFAMLRIKDGASRQLREELRARLFALLKRRLVVLVGRMFGECLMPQPEKHPRG